MTPTITKIRLLNPGDPLPVVVTTGGREVRVEFRDLLDRRRLARRTLEAFHQIVVPPPLDELQRLLDEAHRAKAKQSTRRRKT